MNFKAILALPKTAPSAQTYKSITFIWIVWSTLYVYLWLQVKLQVQKKKKFTELFKEEFLKSHNFVLIKKLIQQVLHNSQICPRGPCTAVVYKWNHYLCLGPKPKPKATLLLGHNSELAAAYSYFYIVLGSWKFHFAVHYINSIWKWLLNTVKCYYKN